MNPETRTCEHCKQSFIITPDEFSMYEKVKLPVPDICFFCRTRQHLSIWTFGKFRKGVSDLSGQNLITILSEGKYPIYTKSEWNSDAWDPLSYGLQYNPSLSFFDQIKELQSKVPRPHQVGSNSVLCDWSDDLWNSKNCYLSRSMDECEDLYYGYRVLGSKKSIDLVFCFNMEISFDCINCTKGYKLFYSEDCQNCIDSYFLFDCRNCSNCFMSYNLRNKSHCIENVQYTKEEYQKRIAEFDLGSYQSIVKLKENFNAILQKKAVHKNRVAIQALNSSGNYLNNVSNVYRGYMFSDSQNLLNALRGFKVQEGIDVTGCWWGEMIGNISCCTNVYDVRYSSWCDNLRYSEYCDLCIDCEYCFGCVGLRKKKYCILNTQYTKEEYETLHAEIIETMKSKDEYGKFFPYSSAPEPYNFTNGALYFPNDKSLVVSLGGLWEERHEDQVVGMHTLELPDHINEVTESICAQALICPQTGWRFNIAPGELQFYTQNQIPLPRVHFDVRTKSRFSKLMTLKPEQYSCVFCGTETEAYYPHEWGYEKIACEECYLKNIA